MTESGTTKLDKIIAGGRTRYVLVRGVLLWGVTTALLVSLLMHVLGPGLSPTAAARNFVIFPIGGIAWGLLMWHWFKKRYAAQHS